MTALYFNGAGGLKKAPGIPYPITTSGNITITQDGFYSAHLVQPGGGGFVANSGEGGYTAVTLPKYYSAGALVRVIVGAGVLGGAPPATPRVTAFDNIAIGAPAFSSTGVYGATSMGHTGGTGVSVSGTQGENLANNVTAVAGSNRGGSSMYGKGGTSTTLPTGYGAGGCSQSAGAVADQAGTQGAIFLHFLG